MTSGNFPVPYGKAAPAPQGTPCNLCGTRKEPLSTDQCPAHRWVRGSLCPACTALMALTDGRVMPRGGQIPAAMPLAAVVSYAYRCRDCAREVRGGASGDQTA